VQRTPVSQQAPGIFEIPLLYTKVSLLKHSIAATVQHLEEPEHLGATVNVESNLHLPF
jgi:hypothetical protein